MGLSLPLSQCVWKDAGTAGGPSAHLEHVVLGLRVLDGQLEARDDFVDFFSRSTTYLIKFAFLFLK